MHLYPVKRRGPAARIALYILLLLVIALLFLYGFFSVSRTAREEQLQSVERAIQKSLVSCYAIEGAYPDSLSYLEEHYGLIIDHSKYVVEYSSFGSNITPSVYVVIRGGLEKGGDEA